MKTSILIKALPLALLCAGVASAQKAGKPISTEETLKLQIVDNSVFGEPKKGNSTAITKNNFSLVTSDGKNISNTTAGVSRANFTWQKKNTNTQKFEDYTNGTFALNGVYRLTVTYKVAYDVNKDTVVTSEKELGINQRSLLRQDLDHKCLIANKKFLTSFDTVKVYGVGFDSAGASITVDSKLSEPLSAWGEYRYTYTCQKLTKDYTYASKEFTVGTAAGINVEAICIGKDGKKMAKCDAEYEVETSAPKYFENDTVFFTVTSKSENFGLTYDVNNQMRLWASGGSGYAATLDSTKDISSSVRSYKVTLQYDIGDAKLQVCFFEGLYKVNYTITGNHGRIEGQPYIYYKNNSILFDVYPEDGYTFKSGNASYMATTGMMTVPDTAIHCTDNGAVTHCSLLTEGNDYKITNDLTIYGEFVESPDALPLELYPAKHASFVVVSNGHEYQSSRENIVNVRSSVLNKEILIKVVPDSGYTASIGNLQFAFDNDYMNTTDISYKMIETKGDTIIYRTGFTTKYYDETEYYECEGKAEHQPGSYVRVYIDVITKKISNVTAEVSGLVKNVSLKDGNATVCSLILESEASGEECKLQEGKTYQVAIDAYDGYPLENIWCKGSGNNLCPTTPYEFKMPAEDVKISLEFNATKFDLSRNVSSSSTTKNYNFYVNGKEAETAHQFDTVYVKYNNPDTAFKFKVYNDSRSTGSNPYYLATHYVGVGEYFFVMPGSNVTGIGTNPKMIHNINIEYTSGKNGFIETVVDVMQKDGDSQFSQSWLSGSVAYTGQLVRFMRETGLGYSLDSVKCDVLEEGTMGTLVLETQGYSMPDRDLSCKFYTSPNPYDITLLDVDNGTVNKLSVGGEAVSEENKARTDDEVSFNVAPIVGYEIDFVKVFYEIPTVAEGPESAPDTVEVETSKAANKSGYTYKFTMPANNVTIAAAFKEINTFTVTFKFGEETKTVKLESGKTPTAPESFKCTESTDEFTYSCAWDKEFAAVTGDVTYTYTQTKTKKSYVIKVAVNDTKMGSVSGLSESGKYEYGTEVKLTAKAKSGYEFSKWNDDVKTAERTVKVTGEKTYTATFKAKATSSSSSSKKTETKVSSSSAKSSSSSSKKTETKVSSSSAKAKSSSSKKKDAILASAQVPMFSVTTVARELQIAGAQVGASYAILDMQGRVMMLGRVDAANFSLSMPRAGSYMLRIAGQAQKVTLR